MAITAVNGVTVTTSSVVNGISGLGSIYGIALNSGGGGGPALVASTSAASTDFGIATTDAIDTTGANLIVVHVAWYNVTTALATVSDNKGNTWSQLSTPSVGGTVSDVFYYLYNPTVGSGHTFLGVAATGYPSVWVYAFSGIASSPADQQNQNGNSGSFTTLTTGSITPSQANTLVIAGLVFEDSGTASVSIDGSFSTPITIQHDNAIGGSAAYKVLTAATAQNRTWTNTATMSTGAASIMSFKY